MGEQFARKIDDDYKAHVTTSKIWARLEEGRGLNSAEAAEFVSTLASGLLLGLKTLALAIDDPEPPA